MLQNIPPKIKIKIKFQFFQVKVVCETRDWEHAKELRTVLLSNYKYVVFNDTPLAISNEMAEQQVLK